MVQKEFAEKLLNLNSYFSASGIITLKAEEGDAVGVGQVVCFIDTEGKPSGNAPVKASDAVQAPAAPAEKKVVTQATYASGSASPLIPSATVSSG